jgi:hypothetical protein
MIKYGTEVIFVREILLRCVGLQLIMLIGMHRIMDKLEYTES